LTPDVLLKPGVPSFPLFSAETVGTHTPQPPAPAPYPAGITFDLNQSLLKAVLQIIIPPWRTLPNRTNSSRLDSNFGIAVDRNLTLKWLFHQENATFQCTQKDYVNSEIALESQTMRTVRNITVAVDPELYRQTRKIAADYDTTVTDMVRFLLFVLPEAVKAARYPGGRPQFGLAAARAAAASPAVPAPNSPAPSLPASPSPGKSEISPCTPVNPTKPVSRQQLAGQESAPVQDKYLSILTIKSLIQKALRVNS